VPRVTVTLLGFNSRIDELLPLSPEWIEAIKHNRPEKATW